MIILIFHRNAICQKFSNHWLGWLAVGKYNNTARNDLKVRVKQLTQLSLGNCLLLYRYSPQSITREKLVTIIKYYTIRFRLFSSPYLIFPYFLFIFYYFIFSWGGGGYLWVSVCVFTIYTVIETIFSLFRLSVHHYCSILGVGDQNYLCMLTFFVWKIYYKIEKDWISFHFSSFKRNGMRKKVGIISFCM